jgi:hypothetical protein
MLRWIEKYIIPAIIQEQIAPPSSHYTDWAIPDPHVRPVETLNTYATCVYAFVVSHNVETIPDYITWNWRLIRKQWIEYDLKNAGCRLIHVLSGYLSGGSEQKPRQSNSDGGVAMDS